MFDINIFIPSLFFRFSFHPILTFFASKQLFFLLALSPFLFISPDFHISYLNDFPLFLSPVAMFLIFSLFFLSLHVRSLSINVLCLPSLFLFCITVTLCSHFRNSILILASDSSIFHMFITLTSISNFSLI